MTTKAPESPIPLADFEASTSDMRDAISLPPECYRSLEFWEFEKRTIFSHEWICVGRQEQIPHQGDYFAITIANEPLVVLRDDEQGVVVLSGVCRHRGMIVAQDSGNCGRYLRCPYHWWTYDLHGQLVTAPQMSETSDFERGDHCLPRLAVEIWNGFIFANFDHTADPLAPGLRKLDEWLTNYHLDELVTTEPYVIADQPFNWKLMMENGVEPYHAPYLHNHLFDRPIGERAHENIGFDDGQGFILSVVPHGFPDASLNPTAQPLFPVIETLTDDERKRFGFCTVPPNLMMGWQSDQVFWFLLIPNGPDTVDLQWAFCIRSEAHGTASYDRLVELARQGVEDYNHDDLPVAAAMHQSMGSRFAPRGRYSVEEDVLTQINRWLVSRYNR